MYIGDNKKVLTIFADNHFDSIVTDPPYGLKFMGKHWDHSVPDVDTFKLMYDKLKPGGHILVACGTRTQHRMAVNIEDAGFEIRDVIQWVYGSGFPKSLDISKAIDKAAGAEREVLGVSDNWRESKRNREQFGKMEVRGERAGLITAPATEDAKKWAGWGTALKPAVEFWTLARKPISEDTIAANVLKYGTGGLNIDGCRVGIDEQLPNYTVGAVKGKGFSVNPTFTRNNQKDRAAKGENPRYNADGRFPANFIHDGSDAVKSLFPDTGKSSPVGFKGVGWKHSGNTADAMTDLEYQKSYTDSGSASRFFYEAPFTEEDYAPLFYCAKAGKAERGESKHPTIKPVSLMRYLCRLVTPPGGVVLDPFAGSGATGEGALLEGFSVVMIERDAENLPDIQFRITRCLTK